MRLSNSFRSGLRRRSATVTIVSASKLGMSLGRQELSKSSMKIGPSGTVGRLRGPDDDTTGPSDGPYRNTRDWFGATWYWTAPVHSVGLSSFGIEGGSSDDSIQLLHSGGDSGR